MDTCCHEVVTCAPVPSIKIPFYVNTYLQATILLKGVPASLCLIATCNRKPVQVPVGTVALLGGHVLLYSVTLSLDIGIAIGRYIQATVVLKGEHVLLYPAFCMP